MQVRQYGTYAACAAGVAPSPLAPCEPGATAVDREDKDLTAQVYACPPPSCALFGTGCNGHQFAVKGLRGCVVSTRAAVGTVFPILFLVFDDAMPPANATATRFVTIVDPCPRLGQVHCEHDGLCGVLTCAQRLQLRTSLDVDAAAPVISFVPGAGREVGCPPGSTRHELHQCMPLSVWMRVMTV
jgi:hypothetical protein